MRARFLTWLFALLLLGMQQGAQVHAIAHLGDALQRPHEQGLQLPTGEVPCIVCSLLAGGSAAIPAGSAASDEPRPEFKAPQHATFARTVAPAHYYLSRAPPTFL
jgi:hypothetical protein